ncbi:ATP-grasp fold amidoligase family protein [Arthrobacter sp. NPDC097144]|uniref:ATP-grasp fold amidoligase family protein n=1 Tax=Arthrobacter sp. NPDC097144 TaxID=3363946 RepID=UPI0038294364
MIKHLARQAFYQPLRFLPLSARRKMIYLRAYKRLPNLRSPSLFSEKINWRILNDRRESIAFTCDKVKMKEYAASKASAVLVPKTIWHGRNLDELATLDINVPWILKPNHSSGQVILGGYSAIDVDTLKAKTRTWLKDFNFSVLGEWAYSRAAKEYVLEEMIGDGRSPLPDYKFYVFDGKVRLIHVDINRFGSPTRRMYTPEWDALAYHNSIPLGPAEERPDNLDEMLEIASIIGEGYDFMRVDLYRNNGKIWFGEMTPYPAGGAKPYRPKDLDQILGGYWELPSL